MAIEQPEKRQFQKRAPAKQVLAKDLSQDLSRVALVGTVVSRNDTVMSFLLDDGSGTVNIIVNDADMFGLLKDGQIVRVLGRIWGEGEDIEIQGDIVQDFSNLDLNLFKKVFASP
jgi:uncharacterized protein YdeI (BOF family)